MGWPIRQVARNLYYKAEPNVTRGGSKSETMGTSFMDGHLSECTHMILIFFAGFTA